MCANKKACSCGCSSKKIVKESSLNEDTKKDLIKQSKIAIDAIYSIYEICDKNKVSKKQFLEKVDKSFEDINEVINLLVVQ